MKSSVLLYQAVVSQNTSKEIWKRVRRSCLLTAGDAYQLPQCLGTWGLMLIDEDEHIASQGRDFTCHCAWGLHLLHVRAKLGQAFTANRGERKSNPAALITCSLHTPIFMGQLF